MSRRLSPFTQLSNIDENSEFLKSQRQSRQLNSAMLKTRLRNYEKSSVYESENAFSDVVRKKTEKRKRKELVV